MIDLSLLSEVLRGDSKVTALALAPQALNDANDLPDRCTEDKQVSYGTFFKNESFR
jgi:hypothetical protein